MEPILTTATNTNPPYSFFPFRDGQEQIYLVHKIFSKNRKGILLNKKDAEPNQCENRQRYEVLNPGNKISNDTPAIQSEVVEKLLQNQRGLELKLKTLMEHMAQRISSLETELQMLTSGVRG
jgi:hypothetical protein